MMRELYMNNPILTFQIHGDFYNNLIYQANLYTVVPRLGYALMFCRSSTLTDSKGHRLARSQINER